MYNLFDDGQEEGSRIVKLAERPAREEITRSENIQMIVAAAIISAYFTTATGAGNPFQDAESHLQALAIVSFIFLFCKLMLVAVMPFGEFPKLKIIDHLILPFLFMLSLLAGIVIWMIITIGINPSNAIPLGYNSVTGILLVFLATLSSIYSYWVYRSMEATKSRMPEHTLTVPSGNSGANIPLTLENKTNDVLNPEDIEFLIDSPEKVDVKIEPGFEVEDHVWQPLVPIHPNSESQVGVRFTRSADKRKITKEEVIITIRMRGETVETHKASLEI